ncbi:MAG: zf-TFIIB domain-containing protein, partial [Deltaproteobacteria bacterium]|nr:zf-TFIIB domain-containing protein [Nannocystaceae bacterium]
MSEHARPEVSAQCPSCGLHELVVVQLQRGDAGIWVQLDRPGLLTRRVKVDTSALRVQIDACPVCFGAWFDPGELNVLAGQLEAVEDVLDPESRQGRRGCVLGHGAMSEHSLPGIIRTPVDRCVSCGGIWLDGHERRKLAKASTSEGQGTKT